jgi:hypothetical protein
MGKATKLADRLSSTPLTPTEIRERKAAAELGDDDVVATLEGKLEKRTPAKAPQPVFRAPTQTWD